MIKMKKKTYKNTMKKKYARTHTQTRYIWENQW